MVFPDASARAEKRTGVIKQHMQRLRRVLAQGSPVYAEVKLAYMDKRGGLVKLRDIMRNLSRGLPRGAEFVAVAGATTKRTKIVEQIVSMLEAAGFDELNRFQGQSTPAMMPSMPMGRVDPSVMAYNNLSQLAQIDPPFPYEASYPDNSLIMMAPKVEYTYRLGIVTPSLVQGRVLCPREPEVQTIDHINIVNGIKHVKGFYEGNVIHVRLPGHKFKDGADKCYYFSILREAFDEYRRQFEEHRDATDRWWQRHVMTDWTVYLDEGNDTFDGPINPEDKREVYENDMYITIDGNIVYDNKATVLVGRPKRSEIPICVTRFDGRNNVGHVRSVYFTYMPAGDSGSAGDSFSVRNLLRFMWKTDYYYVFYQDWFPAHVRRIIISPSENAYADANSRANERAINYLKQDGRNAIFIVNSSVENEDQKEIGRAIRSINEFCLPGKEGYDRLAVVIMEEGAEAAIDSYILTSRANYIGSYNPAYGFMVGQYKDAFDCVFYEVNSTQFLAQSQTNSNKTYEVPYYFRLKFVGEAYTYVAGQAGSDVLAKVLKIYTPLYNLVRFSPQSGFFQLVQKHDMGQMTMFGENDRRNIFIEQVATNHPIFIDEAVLQGFTNPDHGRYMSQGADFDLFVAKIDKFHLINQSSDKKIFIHPNKLPAEYYNFLRKASDFPCVILGVQDDKKSGSCVDDAVEQFCLKNRIPVDLLPLSKFEGVKADEYVFVRTQLHKSTNTIILYEYKFKPNKVQLKVVYKLYNATDMDDTGFNKFYDASQEYL